MNAFRPLRVVHLDLADGLAALGRTAEAAGEADLYVVVWYRGTPLGHLELAPAQLDARASLADAIAAKIAPAVGQRIFGTGFEPVDPILGWPDRGPAPALTELVSLPQPLDRAVDAGDAAERGTLSTTVVVCTRDRPDELRRCLRSIAELAFTADEVVVVDNAPESGSTGPVVEEFPGVRYVEEPRRGLSRARNAAIAASRSDVLAFADDDVVVHPDWLRHLCRPFADPAVMCVTGLALAAELETPAQVAFERLGGLNRGYQRRSYGSHFLERTKRVGAPVWQIGAGASMAVRREAFRLVGGFDVRLGAGASGCSEDSELWYRLLSAGWECRYEPTAVVFHRHRPGAAELKRQARDYTRGHVSSLFVQYARHRDRGNLRRAFAKLPAYLGRRGMGDAARVALETVRFAPYGRTGTARAEIAGYLAGFRFLPFALDAQPTLHKAPLDDFLNDNPYPNPSTEGFFYREKMRAIHAVAPDEPFEEILEVGGGQSGLTALLYPRANVTNLDANPAYADSPPNRRPRVRFVCGDATRLPFPDDSFDAVTMFDVLEHIPDDEAAAAEALRVVKPGGAVLVSTPNERWRFPYYAALRPLCPPEEAMFAEWGHVRRGYSLNGLGDLFGMPSGASASFINPVTVLGHDVAFSRLPSRARRAVCVVLAPVTRLGYALHRPQTPGTETASVWRKAGA